MLSLICSFCSNMLDVIPPVSHDSSSGLHPCDPTAPSVSPQVPWPLRVLTTWSHPCKCKSFTSHVSPPAHTHTHTHTQIVFSTCSRRAETEAGAGCFSSGRLPAVTAVRQRGSMCRQMCCSLISHDSISSQQTAGTRFRPEAQQLRAEAKGAPFGTCLQKFKKPAEMELVFMSCGDI